LQWFFDKWRANTPNTKVTGSFRSDYAIAFEEALTKPLVKIGEY